MSTRKRQINACHAAGTALIINIRVPADAVIDGNSVVVSSPDIPAPVAVQYDWSSFPNGNLYNGAGLPTFPFRSDEK
jgi:hypothetical protein